MKHTRIYIAAPMPLRRAFIAHCHAQGLGVSAGMRLAVEWRQSQLGKPMPYDPADFTTRRGGKTRAAILVSWPREWNSRANGEPAVLAICLDALDAWDAAGRPELKRGPRRGPARRKRDRERAARREQFEDRAVRGVIRISLWKNAQILAGLAQSRGINIGAAAREAMQWAYRRDTGAELGAQWLFGFKAAAMGNDRPDLTVRTLYYPGEWQDALDQGSGGALAGWIREAVSDWLDAQGVTAHRPPDRNALPMKEPKPVVVKPARARMVGTCSRTKQLAAEARDQSRWPVGRGACTGSITGRPYVGTVARDERADGVAA